MPGTGSLKGRGYDICHKTYCLEKSVTSPIKPGLMTHKTGIAIQISSGPVHKSADKELKNGANPARGGSELTSTKNPYIEPDIWVFFAPQQGLEPWTYGLTVRRSNQLSY